MTVPVAWELWTKGRVVVDTPEGAPVLRTVVHADGDVFHFATAAAAVDRVMVARHLADVRERLAPLGSLVERYSRQLGYGLAVIFGVGGLGSGGLGAWQRDPRELAMAAACAVGAWAARRWGPSLLLRLGAALVEWRTRRALQGAVGTG